MQDVVTAGHVFIFFYHEVTDAGVSALVAGCGQLQSINLSHCIEVTDAGVSALEHVDMRSLMLLS